MIQYAEVIPYWPDRMLYYAGEIIAFFAYWIAAGTGLLICYAVWRAWTGRKPPQA